MCYLLRHFTWRRLRNACKLLAGYYASRIWRKPLQYGLPAAIAIEPTTACNLGCPECPSGLKKFTRPTGNLNPQLLHNLLDELAPTLQYLTFYFQGEPFIHPRITELIAQASSRDIFTATSTNAHFISPAVAERIVQSGLHRLIISIDGTTQEVYEQYRTHGQLSKVLEGTRHMLEARKRLHSKWPIVYFQFLVVRPNEHQMQDVQRLARELGVDGVRFKTAQVYEYEHGNALIPTIDRYARYRQNPDGTWSIKNKLLNQCWKMWHSCVVTWDGRVVPCCFDKDANHAMGSVDTEPFAQVWQGAAYQRFRNALLQSRSEIDMCSNCSEGTKVWV
jgi:radical SAM protein with 4Fe4S-binding SPASM domain